MVVTHHHRPTLKQQNKRFKSKHATKSSLKASAKGRISRQSVKSTSSSSNSRMAAQSRLNRRNNAKQIQSQKRQALVAATAIFDGPGGAPRIVAIIPLTEDVNPRTVASALVTSLDISSECPEGGLWTIRADRFKTSIQFINVPYRAMYRALDACKVADYVVFALSPVVEVNDWGDVLLRTLQAQGLPDVVTVVAADPSLDRKARPGIMRSLLSFVQYFFPSQTRVFDLHVRSDRLNAIRVLSEGKPADVRWRDGRTWIVGEDVGWNDGDLRITGVVRGVPLSANRIMHMPDYGDFQISKITSAILTRAPQSRSVAGMEVENIILTERDISSADSFVSRNDIDDLHNEQTWPGDQEMMGTEGTWSEADVLPDAKKGTTPKSIKKVPKGMSEYQAAWIVESDSEDNESGDEVDKVEKDEQDVVESTAESFRDLEMADEQADSPLDKDVSIPEFNAEEEDKQLDIWRKREREERDDLTFPDEIDTPKDAPARTRFQRYRGLRSFRTSPWDPYENLPKDYAQIFQFEDFKRTERGIRRRANQESGSVEVGTRVTVHFQDVPRKALVGPPIFLFSLSQHERKFTVLNFAIQRNTEYQGSVRSKDPFILCVGPRRLHVQPIFSQHTRGGGKGVNNVHKFERYLRHGDTSVATMYGPITFGHQPCALLRESADSQAPHLVATGTFLHPDTTRIIAKRYILTGHPFKVHKKTATVRYMFFNSEDVEYFKPIQLHTKYGRTGHIKESLGTHGYFKAHFDGPINQMDTVCLSLYKRVFPKWSTGHKVDLETMEE